VCVTTALSGVFQTRSYHYGRNGMPPAAFAPAALERAFRRQAQSQVERELIAFSPLYGGVFDISSVVSVSRRRWCPRARGADEEGTGLAVGRAR